MAGDASSTLLPALLLAGAAVAGVGGFALAPRWAAWRRARLSASPFPAAWRRILRRHVPIVARLPADLQLRLKRHVQVFIGDKAFIGCAGQPITDEVRVTIAAQACLLLLGHEHTDVFPGLRQVLVYPSAFAVRRELPAGDGLVRETRQVMTGESWSQGQVVLAWDEVLAGAAQPEDGRNVVVHEFAHQVDQDKGHADGRPWRPGAAARARWARVMDEGLARLRHAPSELVDGYGATSPAEYFAVVCEVFFERPQALRDELPEVHAELVALFGTDPARWT